MDEVCKQKKKIPGPANYDPYLKPSKSPKALDIKPTPRITVFDEWQKHQKKLNIPAAGKYDKIELEQKKTKSKSNMSRAEISSYLDNSMRKSIEEPGVGDYLIRPK